MIIFSTVEQVIQESIQRLKSYNQDMMFEHRDMAIDYYTFNNTGKYIDQYFDGSLQDEIPLYPVNMTSRLINRISLVYKDAPIREIENDNYFDLTMMKNVKMKHFERMHNLLGTMAVQVGWHNDRFKYQPIINFEPIFSPDDPLNPIAITYLLPKATADLYSQSTPDEFMYWDAENHFIFNEKGKITSINDDNINPYGVLPFIFMQPVTMIDEFWNEGAMDIPMANRQVDIAMTMLQHHIRSAGGQWVVEGRIDANEVQLGLNKILAVEGGTVSNISAGVNIESIMSGIKFQLQQVAQNHHITFDFGMSGSKSGVALRMENLELLEAREDEVEKWKFAEKQIYNIERIIAQVEAGVILPEMMKINYDEVEFPDADMEMKEWEWKFKHGLADKVDYLMAKDPDGFESREDAQAYLAERLLSQNQLKVQGTTKESGFKLNRDA